jgi:hypothetical protein
MLILSSSETNMTRRSNRLGFWLHTTSSCHLKMYVQYKSSNLTLSGLQQCQISESAELSDTKARNTRRLRMY